MGIQATLVFSKSKGKGTQPAPPLKFVQGTMNDGGMGEARRRWKATRQWRQEQDGDSILTKPQPDFDIIKEHYPHFCCGRAKCGSICYYERCGDINIRALKDRGIDVEDLIRYYVFMMEYTWNIQCPEEDGPRSKMVSIFDVKGVQLTDFAGDALQFLKTAIATTSAHYPERAVNIVIINAPWIFSTIWGLVKGMVPPATQLKVRIAAEGEQTTEVMQELIDP